MNKILISLLLTGIFTITEGQRSKKSELYIGLVQGISFSSVDFDPKNDTKLLPGYSGGFNIIYSSQPYVGIKLEFNYAQKGWELNLDSAQNYKRILNYFEIPFTTHIMIGKKKSKFFIDLGPYIGFLKDESEKKQVVNATRDYFSLKIQRDFDFGFIFGAGYQLQTKIGRLGIEIKYSNSLTNIFIPSSQVRYFSSRNQSILTRFIYTVQLF